MLRHFWPISDISQGQKTPADYPNQHLQSLFLHFSIPYLTVHCSSTGQELGTNSFYLSTGPMWGQSLALTITHCTDSGKEMVRTTPISSRFFTSKKLSTKSLSLKGLIIANCISLLIHLLQFQQFYFGQSSQGLNGVRPHPAPLLTGLRDQVGRRSWRSIA